MGMPSKEEKVLELFFCEPSKHWHFSDIVRTADISEPAASKWLSKFRDERIIRKIKPRGKMPYFTGNFLHENYRNRKRMFAMQKMYETGLLSRLEQLTTAKAVVIFGSFSRSDWNTESDVDVFVLGDAGEIGSGTLWKGLGFLGKAREVQVHAFRSLKEINKIRSGLMKNVARGYFVKGDLFDILGAVA